jgi:hypothetical protein
VSNFAFTFLLICGTSLIGQETPPPNRVAWMAVFPEPLPDGTPRIGLEYSSQWMRPSAEHSPDGRTFARLDGEEWQITADFVRKVGAGVVNLRVRLLDRSGGFTDAFIQQWHRTFNLQNAGRDTVPNGRLAYHLERDGVVVADLSEPGFHLMDTDVAYVFPFGDARSGGRIGGSLQLPTGDRKDFSGSGGLDSLLGGAWWHRSGNWTFHGQAEWVFIHVSEHNPYRMVLGSQSFQRIWVGAGWQGSGPGFWRGLGLDLTLAGNTTPYTAGIGRIDGPGLQQHWVITHRALPGWRFGISEEAGSYAAPDMTLFVSRSY